MLSGSCGSGKKKTCASKKGDKIKLQVRGYEKFVQVRRKRGKREKPLDMSGGA